MDGYKLRKKEEKKFVFATDEEEEYEKYVHSFPAKNKVWLVTWLVEREELGNEIPSGVGRVDLLHFDIITTTNPCHARTSVQTDPCCVAELI